MLERQLVDIWARKSLLKLERRPRPPIRLCNSAHDCRRELHNPTIWSAPERHRFPTPLHKYFLTVGDVNGSKMMRQLRIPKIGHACLHAKDG